MQTENGNALQWLYTPFCKGIIVDAAQKKSYFDSDIGDFQKSVIPLVLRRPVFLSENSKTKASYFFATSFVTFTSAIGEAAKYKQITAP